MILWNSEIVDRQTFASDSLDIAVCTRFDYPERSGKTYPGTMSPTSPRARFEIIYNRAGVGTPKEFEIPERMKQLGRTSGFASAGTGPSSLEALTTLTGQS
jgi:hypothetical protein